MVDLLVNGEEVRLESNTTVQDLLESYGIQPGRVVVELNRRIIIKEQYAETILAAGDQVELISFVGGG